MERRRSERLSESLPVIVRGIDLLGQPFEERSSTLDLNLHGCRYSSKHHLPRNSWVTLELPDSSKHSNRLVNMRARVAWVQRPHSIREFFQVAVELERPANIWALDAPPANWASTDLPENAESARAPGDFQTTQEAEAEPAVTVPRDISAFMGNPMNEMNGSSGLVPEQGGNWPIESSAAASSPLLRELRSELERQAKEAIAGATEQARQEILRSVEEAEQERAATGESFFRRWKAEFDSAQTGAREEFSAQLGARQNEFLKGLKSEFEQNFAEARELMSELRRHAEALRSENDAAQDAVSRLAQARLQFEALEAAQAAKPAAEPAKEEAASGEGAARAWQQRLTSEMTVALAQWKELLESSLDSSMQRLVEQMSERSQDVLRGAERKMTERITEMRQPLEQASSEARESVAAIKSSLEEELTLARASLGEIEQVAGRTKEYSAQLEAATHDTLNELHRRLEKILDAQTAELNRRAENLAAGVSQRVAPALDSLGQQFLERTMAQMESKMAPAFERVPELLRELTAREVQVEESLRLHRERLRQVAENNQREVSAQLTATVLDLRNDFEAARKEALGKWAEELDATGVRASHSAAESIERTSEWFQQEARARLQVLVEQTLTSATTGFEEKTADGIKKFETQLTAESAKHVVQIHERLEAFTGELSGRARTELDKAAEAAASSFGQVLREISDGEAQRFAAVSRTAMQERERELERSGAQHLQQLGNSSAALVAQFEAQMASQLETATAEGRAALSAEFASTLDGFRTERDAFHKEWAASLDQLGGEAVGRYQERLDTTSDSWVVSSVRRLNEHGQNTIESLLRAADQALRDSCSKVFEGLAQVLRERTANAAGVSGVAGFAAGSGREPSESSGTHNETP